MLKYKTYSNTTVEYIVKLEDGIINKVVERPIELQNIEIADEVIAKC